MTTQSQFADVLRKVPLAVTVVTVGRGGVENGLTVSWASPVSFDPPKFMIAVDRAHYSVDFLRSTRNFAVNVLGADQVKLAGQFARQSMSDEDKLADIPTREGETGAAILTDAVAYFDCEVASIIESGDHFLIIGNVVDAGVLQDAKALVTTETGLRYYKAAAAEAAARPITGART